MPEKNKRYEELINALESSFFWFWIKKYKISYLIVFWIIVLWMAALVIIPKESAPSIKFWIISIATVDIGTNPNDIDALITDKIYKEIKDIKWIDKIQSSSSLGISVITINLKTDANTKDVINEVRNNVNRVSLPSDAKAPVITEVNTDTKMAFSIYIYPKNQFISKNLLIERAQEVRDIVEKVPWIENVKFTNIWLQTSPLGWWGWAPQEYRVELVISPEKLKATGLSLDSIGNTIRTWNKDIPIWNFGVGEKNYDFRIEGKYSEALPILNIPLVLPGGSVIKLSDIAKIERVYKDKSTQLISLPGEDTGHMVIGLSVNKNEGGDIFAVSNWAKAQVEKLFTLQSFQDFSFVYANDLADTIRDDYKELAREAIITLVLVFIAMYLFVGFKDSLFATLTLPLAFFSTFILLKLFWFTLNFLTNFSLILSFWIAVDTIIVIVQWASAKLRVWYKPRTAILLSLREYAVPIISWVTTTIVVFIPMMTLPWILWKFLAYIPITIFGVLATGLILALTVNSALYLLFVNEKDTYVSNETALEYAEPEEREILEFEREWKTEIKTWVPIRIRAIHASTEWYKRTLRKFLENTTLRRTSIILPVIILLLSFKFLAPIVWFDLFPGDDKWTMTFKIEWDNWLRTEEMASKIAGVEKIFSWIPEEKYFSLSINNNIATITVQLLKKDERKAKNMRDVFAVEKILLDRLSVYEKLGLSVISEVSKNGPPGAKAVGLKVIAQKSVLLPILIDVSKDFEKALKKIKWTKNVGTSSKDSPGQFVFTLNKDTLSLYNISPAIVYGVITQMMNGVVVWTLEDNGTDMDIVLKQENFREKVNIENILYSTFSIWANTYQLWNFVIYSAKNAIQSINRENGKILITVDGDLGDGVDSVTTQNAFLDFAKKYNFPSWISFEAGWENQENATLITAVLTAFFVAVLIIFAILTLQFDSYSQPMVILYSVVMSLPFVMVGLILTGNKFSLPFGIWFISFTWIAVNHWIILIDAINHNLKKWMEWFTALVEAGSSRLEPMTLTTVTTMLWILPIALRDKFWSGMWFTIIFGIFAASFLTLFVVKWIYYEIYLGAKKEGIFKKIWRKFQAKTITKVTLKN